MDKFDLVVVGSGPAGISAAAAYSAAGGPGRIAVVTADVDEPYMRPPLSKDSLQRGRGVEPTPIGPELPDGAELLLSTRVTGLDLGSKTAAAGEPEIH